MSNTRVQPYCLRFYKGALLAIGFLEENCLCGRMTNCSTMLNRVQLATPELLTPTLAMQQPLSTVPQPEPDNKFPSCVSMKLHSTPIQPEELQSSIIIPNRTSQTIGSATEQIDLRLTIRFGEGEITVLGSNVRFGLKRGELKLKLENSRIPLEKMGLTAKFEPSVEVEMHQEKGRETQGSASIGIKSDLSATIKGSTKTGTKAKYKVCQVFTRGTEEEPVWVFEVKTNELMLWGQLNEEKLGTVEITAQPCRVEATFEVRGQRDLNLTESEGLLSARNLSRNRTALVTRELFLRSIAPQLQPYLSRVEVKYE